jgi:hypothetical protein
MTGHVWVIQTSLTAPLFIFKCQNHPRIERVSIYPLVSLTILEHLSSPPVFCEVRFTRSLVLCAWFVYICPFVLFHCVVCSSSIYGFWLPLWYLQALLTYYSMTVRTVWYILFVILLQFERCGIFCFSLYDSSNGVAYYSFHFLTVRTVLYILISILWQFERCGIFYFSSYDSSNGVVYFVFHFYDSSNGVEYFSFHFMTVRTVWYILCFIWWQFERCGIFCFSFYYSFADDEVMIRA